MTWNESDAGVLQLPSGRRVRGRSLRSGGANGERPPTHGLYFGVRPIEVGPWSAQWVRWHDFWIPSDTAQFRAALADVWQRCTDGDQRVELGCRGGAGRTGTALACLAIIDGVSSVDAVAYVRRHYDRRSVETPWQRWYVRHFGGAFDTKSTSNRSS